ncbi:hypothetical protein BASA81_005151 [Batrachochytrium salamandrivorans]|nr:hypothetical protein BASA81_005151 [Batrachochytrium salamandrivorans]
MANQTKLKSALEGLERVLLAKVGQVRPVRSIEEFIQTRDLRAWRDVDPTDRTFLLSELLSFPMTLASFINQQQPGKIRHIHVIGARAEATLPDLYWLQLLDAADSAKLDSNLVLSFFGLDVYSFLKNKQIQAGGSGQEQRTLDRKYIPGPYLEPVKPDLAVFFNPGFVSYQNSWKSAVGQVTNAGVPVLVTGYNQVDTERDREFARKFLNCEPSAIMENAFASPKQHPEGDTGRVARANHYVWGW